MVPTNTDETWYQGLSVLGNEWCVLQLKQSRNRDFVAIDLEYSCPIVQSVSYSPQFEVYRVLGLRSSSLLSAVEGVPDKLVGIAERVPTWIQRNEQGVPAFRKQLRLLIPRTVLMAEAEVVRVFIERVLGQIATQSDLIKKDNLAEGSVIEAVTVWGEEKKSEGGSTWSYSVDSLRCAVGADDPPEYWGELIETPTNPVSHLSRFPWMPNEVCAPQR